MKNSQSFHKVLVAIIAILFFNHSLKATTIYTVGVSGASYTTIAAAYSACTSATDYVIELKSNYAYSTETSSGTSTITLGTLANKSAVNTVTIRPQTGALFTFTGNSASIFTLNGADWLTIDGRAGGVGSSALTIINTSSASGAYVFSFQADATNNTLKYLTIKGSGTSTGGAIGFGSGSTIGNINNKISNNSITKSASGTPSYGIYSYGTSASINNSSITVSNNNFYDLGQGDWCGIVSYSDSWTVSGNSFYQSANISLTTTNLDMIYVGANCVSVTITDNYFGGRSSNCGSTAFTITTGAYQLNAIDFNAITGSVSILRNTISNITATSTGANSVVGIYTYGTAAYTIGSLGNGNTIGSTATNGSITINGSTGSTAFYAIQHWGTNISNTISYNTIAGITQTHNTAGTFPAFYGITAGLNTQGSITNNSIGSSSGAIQLTGTGIGINYKVISWVSNSNSTISNNTFQNFTISNASATNDNAIIYVSGSGTNTISTNSIGSTTANNMTFSLIDNVNAIHCYSKGSPVISGNTIQQFNQTGTGSTAGITGINIEFLNGLSTISSNTIKNCTTAGTGASSFSGIYLESTSLVVGNSVSGNTISTITATSTGAGTIVGIWAYDGGGTFQKNKITGITFNSSNTSANLFGMTIDAADNLNFYNNVILLNNGSGSAVLRGILNRSGAAKTYSFYHNTVKIFGTATSGSNNSNAFTDINSSGSTIQVKNNIFQNTRSNSGGTGTHISIRFASSAPTINSDYNYLEASGNGGSIGVWNGANYATFASYRAASSKEVNSKSTSITISSTGEVPAGNTSNVSGTGTNLFAIVTDDFIGSTRSTTPWMGAFENVIVLPIEIINFSGSKNGNSNELKWTTLTEMNSAYFTIEKTVDGKNYDKVGTVEGAGNSFINNEYSLTDFHVENSINYYRLSQTDFEGKSKYSELISIDNRLESNSNREILYKTNILGQLVDEYYSGLVVLVFTDGSSMKTMQ